LILATASAAAQQEDALVAVASLLLLQQGESFLAVPVSSFLEQSSFSQHGNVSFASFSAVTLWHALSALQALVGSAMKQKSTDPFTRSLVLLMMRTKRYAIDYSII
jgi:hypothetical protein